LARDSHLLESNGNWAPAGALLGVRELVSYYKGRFVPVKAHIEPGPERIVFTYRSGSYRYISPVSPIEFLDENGWRDIRTLYIEERLSTHHVLRYNKIIVPRLIPIFGDSEPLEDWIDVIVAGATLGPQLNLPGYLVNLNKVSLVKVLRKILNSAYPNIRIYKGGFLDRTPTIRLTNIEENSRRLLVHLFARFGIRARRYELQSLHIRELQSKQILAGIMGIYQPRRLNIDKTMKDWIWVRYPRGRMETVVVETEAENICDGLFIWRKSRTD